MADIYRSYNMQQALRIVVLRWVNKLAKDIQVDSEKHQRAKGVRITSGSDPKGFRATLYIRGRNAKLSFDYDFLVPPGGIPPPPGMKAWAIHKTGIESDPVFVSRIYKNKAGSVIKRKGFVSLSVEKNFTQRRLMQVAQDLGKALSYSLAHEVANNFKRHGINATVTSFH